MVEGINRHESTKLIFNKSSHYLKTLKRVTLVEIIKCV